MSATIYDPDAILDEAVSAIKQLREALRTEQQENARLTKALADEREHVKRQLEDIEQLQRELFNAEQEVERRRAIQ